MALAPINPTQLTPPRVSLIDERSGAISREWYRFFLSLLTATQDIQQKAQIAPVIETTDFTVTTPVTWIINNKAGSTCVVTLPFASAYQGRYITFQNYQNQFLVSASANVVPRGGGAAAVDILGNVAGSWATLVSDGTNWVIMQASPYNVLLI